MAPAHPHATGVAVYPALFFSFLFQLVNNLKRFEDRTKFMISSLMHLNPQIWKCVKERLKTNQ